MSRKVSMHNWTLFITWKDQSDFFLIVRHYCKCQPNQDSPQTSKATKQLSFWKTEKWQVPYINQCVKLQFCLQLHIKIFNSHFLYFLKNCISKCFHNIRKTSTSETKTPTPPKPEPYPRPSPQSSKKFFFLWQLKTD